MQLETVPDKVFVCNPIKSAQACLLDEQSCLHTETIIEFLLVVRSVRNLLNKS